MVGHTVGFHAEVQADMGWDEGKGAGRGHERRETSQKSEEGTLVCKGMWM